ncbi:hypothetical protein NL676_036982 [Syzygium grande]|nr:hypothetical protein NL676_036982 [Syzygium grande]
MSSSKPAILDREVLVSNHNEYVVTFEDHTIHTLLTYSPFVSSLGSCPTAPSTSLLARLATPSNSSSALTSSG